MPITKTTDKLIVDLTKYNQNEMLDFLQILFNVRAQLKLQNKILRIQSPKKPAKTKVAK